MALLNLELMLENWNVKKRKKMTIFFFLPSCMWVGVCVYIVLTIGELGEENVCFVFKGNSVCVM